MKKILLLVLLASCTSAPQEDATQKAVSDYLRKTLDDPASYQPAHWGPPKLWRKVDEAQAGIITGSLQAVEDSLEIPAEAMVYQATARLAKTNPSYAAQLAGDKAKWEQAIAKHAATRKRVDSLRSVTDTTRLGYLVTHSFRAKNKLGAIILDSARFEVGTNGQVKVWDTFKR